MAKYSYEFKKKLKMKYSLLARNIRILAIEEYREN